MEIMKATGMKGSVFVGCFLLFKENAECFLPFVSLRNRRSEEGTCVDGGGGMW